ncbi:hypothetical protein CHELA40_12618 [Chelatococcus asaccharovorans]|nr:hypothetical protein CHELA40_12618 [Chelatococcus asaccharovorans]CAH1682146.1 hypothetical protein CHELA17_62997 [Chelatococcus asaccharovorans]
MHLFPSLRRHDPDQVLRVTAVLMASRRNLSPLTGPPSEQMTSMGVCRHAVNGRAGVGGVGHSRTAHDPAKWRLDRGSFGYFMMESGTKS